MNNKLSRHLRWGQINFKLLRELSVWIKIMRTKILFLLWDYKCRIVIFSIKFFMNDADKSYKTSTTNAFFVINVLLNFCIIKHFCLSK